MLWKAKQAARPRSAQFAAAGLQRSTTRHAKTRTRSSRWLNVFAQKRFEFRSNPPSFTILFCSTRLICTYVLSASTCGASIQQNAVFKWISSNLLLLEAAALSNKSLQRTAPAPCSVMPLATSLESSETGKPKSVRILCAGESGASGMPSFGAVRRR